MSVHVFVGPTLPADRVLSAVHDATVHPPVVHGDLLQLSPGPADVVVLIDGYYHQNASVRHKEILALLATGTTVIGCASMGALRAVELQRFGMIGHGAVYELYRSGKIDGDDEVAMVHSEAPEYQAVSVPLVNIRHAATAAASSGALTAGEADIVIRIARSVHYKARSWQMIDQAARACADMTRTDTAAALATLASLHAFLEAHPEHADLKADDATDTLRRIDELVANRSRESMAWAMSTGWRNRFLYDWEANFIGETVAGVHVSHAMVAKYQQIYHPDFPGRWREFVLTRISAATASDFAADLRTRALAAAEANGLTTSSLAAGALRHWLTDAESSRLSGSEKLLLALTRSFKPPRLARDLIDVAPDLTRDHAAQAAVAESCIVNAETAAKRPGQTVDRIKADLLRTHLARHWEVDLGDDEALLASARDRGFESIAAAVESVRPYFIRRHFHVDAKVDVQNRSR